ARVDRHLHIACVSGEAGLGKTRLLEEFVGTVPPHEARLVTARCIALTRTRPLAMAAELLRHLIGVEESDPEQAQLDALRLLLATDEQPLDDPLPFLASVLGIVHADAELESKLLLLDEAMLQQQTHAAMRRALLCAASAGPLLVLLDDLHWVDAASRDMLAYVLQSDPEITGLIVMITRTHERETLLAPLLQVAAMDAKRFTDLALGPLTAADARALARRLIAGPSPAAQSVRQKIIARAEGNPFYVEELTRMLADRGGLSGVPGQWEVTPDAEAILKHIPASLGGLILTRFDALERDLRRVLQRAAILGRSFPVRLLQELVEPEHDIPAMLAELEEREFLAEEAFGLEKGYTFRHVLVQEAIHNTLLRRDRQELHQQVAVAIENTPNWTPAERNELLAYHWSESSAPDRAVPYLLAAAEHAARRHANENAIDHGRRAMTILAGTDALDERMIRARLVVGRALKFTGRLGEAKAALDSAASALFAGLHRAEETPPALVTLYSELLRELADVEAREGKLEDAFRHLEEALLAVAAFDDPETQALRFAIQERLAWVRFRQGHLDDALKRADEVLKVLEEEPDKADPATLASLYNTLGGVLWSYGKLENATFYVRNSLTLYHKIGYLFGKANALANLGVLYHALGKWPEAVEHFERSDWIRREIGCMVGRGTNLQNLGLVRLGMGQHIEARDALETSLRIAE
ncbi:MAG: tetratricopeptide repeat protein, partial [Thermoanaerobaculia bacterium]